MQEPDESGDLELVTKLNDALGCAIPEKDKLVQAGGPAAGIPGVVGVAGASGASGANAEANQQLQEQLLAMLRNAQNNNANSNGPAGGPQVSLTHILKRDVLLSLAEDPAALAELKQHLPDSQREDADVGEMSSWTSLFRSFYLQRRGSSSCTGK